MKGIDYIPACVAGIEIFIFGHRDGVASPVLFFTHGRGGSVVASFEKIREMAAAGITVIGLNQRNHGRQQIEQRLNTTWGAEMPSAMYAIMLGTSMDISLLIDMIPAQLGIALPRIGMAGGSLGGHVTLLAMAMDRRIDVGAAMIPSGDYKQLMQARMASNNTPPEEICNYYPPALEQAVAKFDPLVHAANFADRPLLMTCGADDTLVPADSARSFYQAALPHYTHPDRLKLSIYEGVPHDVPPAMWQENAAWLKKWLLQG